MSATIENISRGLILEHEFVPLEKVLPESAWIGPSFEACLAKIKGSELLVYAFFPLQGQEADDLALRLESLRDSLQKSEAYFSGRILATVFFVSEQAFDSGLWERLKGVAEGHFLSKILLYRCFLVTKPGEKASLQCSGPDPFPGRNWFLNQAKEERTWSREEVEAALSLRTEEEQSVRQWFRRRNTWATYLLIGLNVAYFLLYSFSDNRDLDYLALGANNRVLVLKEGQWWRLFSSQFLHFGWPHLLMNMISLFSIGTFLERMVGPRRFLFIYFASGLAGSLLGLLNPPVLTLEGEAHFLPSGGASGAVLGLVGALLALHWRRPSGFPKSVADRLYRALARPTLFIFALGAGIWLLGRFGWVPFQIDNWAHLGGLSCGFALSFFFPFQQPQRLDKQA